MRIGVRHDKPCSKITMTDGREFVWADEIRYLGIFIVRAIKFKCSMDAFNVQPIVYLPGLGD